MRLKTRVHAETDESSAFQYKLSVTTLLSSFDAETVFENFELGQTKLCDHGARVDL